MLIKTLSYSLCIIFSQWLIIKVLLNSGGLKFTGNYFYYLSVVAPVFMLLGANFKNYATQYSYGSWEKLFRYRALSLLIITGVTVTLFIYEQSEILLLVFLFKSAEYMLDTTLAAEIRFNVIKYSVLLAIFMLLVVFSFYILSIESQLGFKGALNFCCFLLFINIIASFIRARYFCKQSESCQKGYSYESILLLVGFPAFLISITASIPRLSLEYFSGTKDVAVFGAFIYFYLISQVITISLFQSKIKAIEKRKKYELSKLIMYLTFIGLLGLMLSVFFGEHLISIIFSESLVYYRGYLPYFIGFIIFGSYVQVLEQYFVLTSKNKALFKVNLLMLIFSLVICPVAVFYFGLNGAVWYMYLLHTVKFFILFTNLD